MTYGVWATDDLGKNYGELLDMVRDKGQESSPRGQLIKELRPLQVTVNRPKKCVVKRPGMSRAFMFAEQLQLLAGEFDQAMLQRYSTRAASMLNHYGAYGPRLRGQLQEVVKELANDPDSRRAVAYVCRPSDLTYATELNMPCTMGYQFFIRDDALECIASMRSWDIVWGLSYDIPNAAQLQMCVAAALGIKELGSLTFVANSGHIYEKHFDLVPGTTDYELPSMASPYDGILATVDDARQAFEVEKKHPGGYTRRDLVPAQWDEPFNTFIRALEKRGA
jgi:thymidylate synthase